VANALLTKAIGDRPAGCEKLGVGQDSIGCIDCNPAPVLIRGVGQYV
jgi:hypothetical protein